MAAVLLRLKLAIQARGRGSDGHASGFAAWWKWLVAAVLGVLGAALVGFLEGLDGGASLVLIVFVVLFVGWVLLPVMSPVLQDQTVDPELLEMYPLTTWEKVSGLLLGGLVAPTALFTFLTASGGALAPDEPVAVRVAVPLVSAVFVVLCVASSRAVQSLLTSATRSRRGRDLVLIGGGLIGIGAFLAVQFLGSNTSALEAFASSTAAAILEWTPPGAAGQINLDMRDQAWADSIGGLAYVLGWIAAAIGLWVWALGRRVKGGGHAANTRSRATLDAGSLALTSGPMAILTASPTTASFAQQAHYLFFRNPRAAQQVVISLLAAAFLAHTSGMEHGLVFAAALYGAFATISMGSGLFNYDSRGAEFLLIAGAPWRRVLIGKFWVTTLVALVATAVFAVIEAIFAGTWGSAAGAGLAGFAGVLWAASVGALVSVLTPFDTEHRRAGRGRGAIGLFGGLGVAAGGVIGVSFLLDATGLASWLIGVIAIVVAAVVAWIVLRVAGSQVENRQMAVVQAVAG